MTAFRSYWHQPKGSTSTAFKNWVKPDFRGDLLVFERMTVDEFETGYKGVVKDAAAFANGEEALHEEKLAQEAKARAEALASRELDLESERAKARAIKFE